ncbi:MAG: hypothetical protein MJ113_07395, partial [Lachnospiraceae bacterium]|nr:hypothetical protein [Lachnospiraceae bacterium]
VACYKIIEASQLIGGNCMNKFELYCMIFLALDADWDDTQDEELGKFLSDANPFLFAGNVSAVRSIYKGGRL